MASCLLQPHTQMDRWTVEQMTAAARTRARRQTTIGPEQQTVGVLPEGESPRVALAKTCRPLTQISPSSWGISHAQTQEDWRARANRVMLVRCHTRQTTELCQCSPKPLLHTKLNTVKHWSGNKKCRSACANWVFWVDDDNSRQVQRRTANSSLSSAR